MQDAHRSLNMVFRDFPGPFMGISQDFPEPSVSIFHVFPRFFNQVDIEQVKDFHIHLLNN